MAGDDASWHELLRGADALVDEPIPPPSRPAGVPPYASRAEAFIEAELDARGDSHGAEHARIVRDNALAILAELRAVSAPAGSASPPTAQLDETLSREAKVVELAALLHDVCDHKYCDPATDAGRAVIARRDACLAEVTVADEARDVLAIVEAVSFSREKRGQLRLDELPPGVRALRDIVSDADKLEAIGTVGLRRCIDYRLESAAAEGVEPAGPEAVARDVAAHCDEKLLRLRDRYIRTEPGRRLALARHRALAAWRRACARAAREPPLVSCVMSVRDGEPWLAEALRSVGAQAHRPLELSVYDDGSTDGTAHALAAARDSLEASGVRVLLSSGPPCAERGRGIGYAQNRAIEQACGEYVCFVDADDVSAPERVAAQLARALDEGVAPEDARLLVGSGFSREPLDATPRYSRWANGLSDAQLVTHRLREVTLIHPTWFCARAVLERLGGFREDGPGFPEDLDFFYRHLSAGGALARLPGPLVMWRYVASGVTVSRGVHWRTIWDMRVAQLEGVLRDEPWASGFSIWGAGKEGRRLYRSLSEHARARVRAFCDVDARKMAAGYTHHESGAHVPVVHFREARAPLLLCVKDFDGEFAANLASLGLEDGVGYLHFSF